MTMEYCISDAGEKLTVAELFKKNAFWVLSLFICLLVVWGLKNNTDQHYEVRTVRIKIRIENLEFSSTSICFVLKQS